jgi:hypothetical protein
MRRKLIVCVFIPTLALFALPSRAEAWGCYHAGYTHTGYGGTAHGGVTVSQHPSPYASSRQSGTYHYGGTTVHSSSGYTRRW